MATVRFGHVDEFVEELRRDAGAVDRGVVRLTFRTTFEAPDPTRSVAVLASAVVAGHVLRLEARCGSFFPDTDEAAAVVARAEESAEEIRKTAESLGLHVRPGVFE